MTALDVVFRYGSPPGDAQMRGLNRMREVYGVRRIVFDHNAGTVRVEYDASRLSEAVVAGLLRRAGLDLKGKVALV
jgi:hypothetical protein